jgi:hypothetical protein
MSWHIFRKDWRFLWRVVVAVAVANVIQRAMLSRAEQLTDGPLLQLANLFGLIVLLATAVLIVVVVHQDPLPGLRQDWLVRPIRRTDLLLSKLLFIALLVQGPIFLAEIGQGLMAGLPLWPSVGAASSRNCWMLLAMDLPCLALASLTRNLVQAVGAGLATALGFIFVLGFDLFLFKRSGGAPQIRWATIAWVAESAQTAWGLLAVAVVLTLQYRRRKTNPARWALGAAALIWIFMEILPWRAAFAIQERFSRRPEAASAVQIGFDPGFGRRPGPPANPESMRVRRNVPERAAYLYIPLRISGLSGTRRLLADDVMVHITDSTGNAIELDPSPEPREFRESPTHHMISVQEAGYNRVKDQPLRIEIDYSLTLLQANREQTIPALGGDRWLPELGRCTARADASGTQIDLHCVAPGSPPCTDWFLENVRTGLRGPRVEPPRRAGMFKGPGCWPDYAPYVTGIGGDPSVRFGTHFSLGSLVERSQLSDARLVSLVYTPEVHFTRHLVIPDIRLSDWRAE